VRAWRTAELLHGEAGWPRPQRCGELEAERDPREAAAVVRDHEPRGAVAVVGHEPHLSRLISLLLARDPDAVRAELKKGGAAALVVEAGGAALRWSIPPRVLRALGD
jgi:phosphohistidine phosphatase